MGVNMILINKNEENYNQYLIRYLNGNKIVVNEVITSMLEGK